MRHRRESSRRSSCSAPRVVAGAASNGTASKLDLASWRGQRGTEQFFQKRDVDARKQIVDWSSRIGRGALRRKSAERRAPALRLARLTMLTAHTVHQARETTMLRRLCSRANPSRARWYPTTVPSGWAPAIAAALVNAGLGVNPRGGATRVAAAGGRAPLVAACTSGRDPAFTPSAGPLAPAFARTLPAGPPRAAGEGHPRPPPPPRRANPRPRSGD